MKLSLCIATYNEEKNLHYPLDSALDLVDEVVVVDGGSTDKTIQVAKSYGKKVKVYQEKFERMFHINKQKAIERARGEWILQLDADEALSDELRDEIKEIVHRNYQLPITNNQSNSKSQIQNSDRTSVAYYIPRKNFFLTRFLMKGGQYPDYTIRLYRNGAVRFPCKNVHENVEIVSRRTYEVDELHKKTSEVNKKIGYLKNPILHYADPNFSRYLMRWDRYNTLEAENIITNDKSQMTNYKLLTMFFDYFFIKPSYWFFKAYFRHLGFLDGFPGFVFAFFSSIRFWAIYVKVWALLSAQKTKS